MKKALKIFGITFGALAIICVVAIVALIWALPSKQEIAKYFKQSDTKVAVSTTAESAQNPAATPVPTASENSPAAPTEDSNSMTLKNEEGLKTLENFLDERKPLVSFCDSLKNAGAVPTQGKFGDRFKASLDEGEGRDPLMETIKPILKFNLRQPRIRSLLDDLRQVDPKQSPDSFFGKAEFYSKLYGVYSEMKQNQQKTEELMDRTYHMMMMSKVLAQKPELSNDPQVSGYCQRLEESVNRGEPASFEEERKSFEEFLAFSGVDGDSIGYNPEYKTHLNVALSSTSVTFQGGWMEDVIQESQLEPVPLDEEDQPTEVQ